MHSIHKDSRYLGIHPNINLVMYWCLPSAPQVWRACIITAGSINSSSNMVTIDNHQLVLFPIIKSRVHSQ